MPYKPITLLHDGNETPTLYFIPHLGMKNVHTSFEFKEYCFENNVDLEGSWLYFKNEQDRVAFLLRWS